jgi:addiction module RelB/DinJ family antitoxin
MTHKQTLSITLDASLKAEVQDILKSRGLSMSEAIRLFFQQIQQHQGLPFALPHTPNATTRQALADAEDGQGEVFETVAELYRDLGLR